MLPQSHAFISYRYARPCRLNDCHEAHFVYNSIIEVMLQMYRQPMLLVQIVDFGDWSVGMYQHHNLSIYTSIFICCTLIVGLSVNTFRSNSDVV